MDEAIPSRYATDSDGDRRITTNPKGRDCYWCGQGVGHIHRVELEFSDDVDQAIKAVELGDAGANEASVLAEEVWRLRHELDRLHGEEVERGRR